MGTLSIDMVLGTLIFPKDIQSHSFRISRLHDTIDESNPFLFLEHAGVIYEKNGSVYLLEKLAFQEPYQWIKFPSEEEIIKYFESKYNLDTTGKMAKPIYMINDKLF